MGSTYLSILRSYDFERSGEIAGLGQEQNLKLGPEGEIQEKIPAESKRELNRAYISPRNSHLYSRPAL